MSAFDPKRTFVLHCRISAFGGVKPRLKPKANFVTKITSQLGDQLHGLNVRKGAAMRKVLISWRCISAFVIAFWIAVPAKARDLGQCGNQDPALRQWFESLRLPGDPTCSCCGEADAYWADDFEVKGDQYVAIITDPRPDGPLGRVHIEPGTRYFVPNYRIVKRERGNPTGHGLIFILDNLVFCYLPPEGA